jgi:hypothetical protein
MLGQATISEVPVPSDCVDGFFDPSLTRPEAYLSSEVRRAQSGWHQIGPIEHRAVAHLAADLASGECDRRHGPGGVRELRRRAAPDRFRRLADRRSAERVIGVSEPPDADMDASITSRYRAVALELY